MVLSKKKLCEDFDVGSLRNIGSQNLDLSSELHVYFDGEVSIKVRCAAYEEDFGVLSGFLLAAGRKLDRDPT